MRRLRGTSVIMLVVVATTAGCVSDSSDSSSATTESAGQPAENTTLTEQEVDAVSRLPDGYEVVGARATPAPGGGGKTVLQRVAAVGRTDADPRLIEYTLYEFDDEESARAAVAAPQAVIEPVALDRGGTLGFVETGQPIDHLRSQLGLIPYGPGFDAFFQVLVTPTVLAVGGSAVVQPSTLAPLLESLSTEPETFEQGLPDGMSVLVDDAPLEGVTVELLSALGTTSMEMYPRASRSWFDYFSWGTGTDATASELVDLGTDIRVRPPERFEAGPSFPERTMVWDEARLTIVNHPAAEPSAELAELVAFFLALDDEDVLGLVEPTAFVDDGREDAPTLSGREPVSDAPTADDMARLQDFVEGTRGIEAGQPIVFEFVEDFPVIEAGGMEFLSADLWWVAVALGLTEEGQTLEGANQARIDRVKGTPGVVELQATRPFTEFVVVHEMVHVIDPAPRVTAEPELLRLGQAVAEGNANRVAFEFIAELPADEQAVLPDFPAIFAPEGDERISTAVQDLLEFPYDEGRVFMTEIADRGGEALIETVLDRPPVSTEQLLFVDAWEGDDAPVAVERPTTPNGAEPLSSGTLGVYLLYLTAREAGLGQEALGVLEQWAGDSFVAYQDDGRICIAGRILMDTARAAAELQDVLDESGSLGSAVTAGAVDTVFCA